MMLTVLIDYFANDLFRLFRRLARCRQRRIRRQPNVDIRKVRKILREELRLQLRHEHAAADQKQERAGHDFPTMLNGPRAELVITSSKTFRTSLLDRHFG